MQGDCLERMKEIESGSVDMILTDPPYGTTACKWDSIIPLEPMWEQLKRIIKPNGAIVMTASQPFTTTLISSNMKMFKYCWVWEKSKAPNFVQVKNQPLKNYEDVLVFTSKGEKANYFPQMTAGESYKPRAGKKESEVYNKIPNHKFRNGSNGKRYPKSIQYFKTAENEGGLHPTQKPVSLMEYLIKTYTNEGETVLDFTMGSGSTGVAAKNLNRDFIGIELGETYFNIAQERIANA